MAFRHHLRGDAALLHGTDQPDAPLDLAIIKHEARSRDLQGGSARALVDQQDGSMIGKTTENVIQALRMIALALRDCDKACFCSGSWMDIDRPPVGDDKALGAKGFQPNVISARCDRAFNASGK